MIVGMFDHEKLDTYRVRFEFVTWSDRLCERLKGADRHARDQLLRASQSIPLNLAEGKGKLPSADRQRYLPIALGPALECAATLDGLAGCGAIGEETARTGKGLRVRIGSMRTKMASGSKQHKEESEYEYAYECEYEQKRNREPEAGGNA